MKTLPLIGVLAMVFGWASAGLSAQENGLKGPATEPVYQITEFFTEENPWFDSVQFSHDGAWFAVHVVSFDGDHPKSDTIQIFASDTGKLIRTIRFSERQFNEIVISPDNSWIAACDAHREELILYSLKELQLSVLPIRDHLSGLAFTPDGKSLIYVGNTDYKPQLIKYDLETVAATVLTSALPRARSVEDFIFYRIICSQDRIVLEITQKGLEQVQCWMLTGVQEKPQWTRKDLACLSVNPRQSRAFAFSSEGLISLDLETGKTERILHAGKEHHMVDLKVAYESQSLVAISHYFRVPENFDSEERVDSRVFFWDLMTGSQLAVWDPEAGVGIRLSPDGKYLLATDFSNEKPVFKAWKLPGALQAKE